MLIPPMLGVAKNTEAAQVRNGAPENGFYTRWDYYYELGCPEIKNMDDILTVCKQMQDNSVPVIPESRHTRFSCSRIGTAIP